MKRSPLKRKTPLRANTRLQSVTARPPVNYQAILASSAEKKLERASRQEILANLKQERAAPSGGPKTSLVAEPGPDRSQRRRRSLAPQSKNNRKRPRNFPYMLWIKTLPCAICGRNGAEAAHTGARGLGQKAPDEQCIPLCPDHHRHRRDALDVAGPRRFQEMHGIDIKALVMRLQGAWKLLQDNPPITAFNPAIDETNRIDYGLI